MYTSFMNKLHVHVCVHPQSLSRVWLFATLWAVACQAPLSMGFSRQEYWSGLPFPSSFTCTRKQKEFMWLALLQYLLYCSVLDPNLQYLQSMPIYSYTAILFGNKKKWSTDTCFNMDEPWKHYVKWDKTVTNDHIFYDSI